MKVSFNLPEIGITGDYVVTERKISPLIKDLSSEFEENLKVEYKLTDRSYIQSYAEILDTYAKEKAKLSIREDQKITDIFETNEIVEAGEDIDIELDSNFVPLWATSAAQFAIDGALFSPAHLSIYPWTP